MRHLWATFVVEMKVRIWVRICAFVSCCAVAFGPGILFKVVALVPAICCGYLMLFLDYAAITQPVVMWWKLRGKVSWAVTPPNVKELAKAMGVKLNKKNPVGFTKIPIGAVASVFTGQVILGSDVLALPQDEQDAVIAHELAHLRPKQAMLLFMLMYVTMLGALIFNNANPIIMIIGVTGLFLTLRTVAQWKLERDADQVAARFTSKEALASALRRLVKPEDYNKVSDTHPSVNNRVKWLMIPQVPLWMRMSNEIVGFLVNESFRTEFLSSFLQDLNEQTCGKPHVIRETLIVVELVKITLLQSWMR